MLQYVKQGFGIAVGLVAGFAVLGAITNGLKIDISRVAKEEAK